MQSNRTNDIDTICELPFIYRLGGLSSILFMHLYLVLSKKT